MPLIGDVKPGDLVSISRPGCIPGCWDWALDRVETLPSPCVFLGRTEKGVHIPKLRGTIKGGWSGRAYEPLLWFWVPQQSRIQAGELAKLVRDEQNDSFILLTLDELLPKIKHLPLKAAIRAVKKARK